MPVELTREQSISLAMEYVKQHFVAAGICADVCSHDTGGGNPHTHIVLTMRPFEWGAKQRKAYILDPQGNNIFNMEQLRRGHAIVSDKYCRARFCAEWAKLEITSAVP